MVLTQNIHEKSMIIVTVLAQKVLCKNIYEKKHYYCHGFIIENESCIKVMKTSEYQKTNKVLE